MTESELTATEAGSCREAGEELLREQPVPFGDEMQQLRATAQQLPTLRATELLRGHGAHKAMAGGARVAILDQLPTFGSAQADWLPNQASIRQTVLWCIARSSIAVSPGGV